MLDGLCGVVKAEVDSELINSAHTHAILLRQLFQTADRWHLNLEAKISELENRCVGGWMCRGVSVCAGREGGGKLEINSCMLSLAV